ncbi:MAG: DUF6262 family protein [Actinomycetota bacterium]|nr:DUF6262 family protein [Actinomycetota bacterium]
MQADNTHHVIAAARRRSEATMGRAVAALRRMDATGTAITFDSVARHAGVSRAWLYTQPELRAEIERLRQNRRPGTHRPVPDRQRGTDASLRQRIDTALGRIRELESDNRRLRAALAEALGHNRTLPATTPTSAPPNAKPTTADHLQAINDDS